MECRSIYSFSCAMCCCSLAVEIHSFVSFCGVSIYAFIYFFFLCCHTIHSYHTAKIFFFLHFLLYIHSVRRPTDRQRWNRMNKVNEWNVGCREREWLYEGKSKRQSRKRENENVHNAYSLYTVYWILYTYIYTQQHYFILYFFPWNIFFPLFVYSTNSKTGLK